MRSAGTLGPRAFLALARSFSITLILSLVTGCTTVLGDADVTILGAVENYLLGSEVARVGDVDADGVDDVIIGAPGPRPSVGGPETQPGVVYLVRGPLARDHHADEFVEMARGEGDIRGLGARVDVGDVNGDGIEDIILGSHAAIPMVLLRGTDGGQPDEMISALVPGWDGSAGSVRGPYCVADLDGDGITDLVISDEEETSRETLYGARVFFGPLDGTRGTWPADDSVGFGIDSDFDYECSGDLTGDGVADLVVKQGPYWDPYHLVPAALSVISWEGGSSEHVIHATIRDRLGWSESCGFDLASVASGADVSGDGLPDLVVGAERRHDDCEDDTAVLVFHGPISSGYLDLDAADARLRGDDGADRFQVHPGGGTSEGRGSDLLVTAARRVGPSCREEQESSPRCPATVYLWTADLVGRGQLRMAPARWERDDPTSGEPMLSAWFAGDFDADGVDDVWIGDPYADDNAGDVGAVYLFSAVRYAE